MDYGRRATRVAPLGSVDSISWRDEPGEFHARDTLRRRARHRAREKQIPHRCLPVETAVSHMPDRRAVNIQSRPSYCPSSNGEGATNFFAQYKQRQLLLPAED